MLLKHSFSPDAAYDAILAAIAAVPDAGYRTVDIAGPGKNVIGTADISRRIAEAVVAGSGPAGSAENVEPERWRSAPRREDRGDRRHRRRITGSLRMGRLRSDGDPGGHHPGSDPFPGGAGSRDQTARRLWWR